MDTHTLFCVLHAMVSVSNHLRKNTHALTNNVIPILDFVHTFYMARLNNLSELLLTNFSVSECQNTGLKVLLQGYLIKRW